MKQKYTVTIAGTELNLVSDATPEEVTNIADAVDRRMRDINLRSPRCSKAEAATLCALAFCSEQIATQQSFRKVERDAKRYSEEIERLKRLIETLQKEKDALAAETERLRRESDGQTEAEKGAETTPAPAKTRVGGMFDLLTFRED